MPGVIFLLLAAVFLMAVIAKLRSQHEFAEVLQNLIPASLVRPAATAIPLAELALAAFLLSGIAPHTAALLTIIVLTVFTGFLVTMQRRGVKGCGCFGETAATATSGNGIIRNLLLITVAIIGIAMPAPALYGPDFSTFLGRLTVVAGGICLWSCLVALVQRRKYFFNYSKT